MNKQSFESSFRFSICAAGLVILGVSALFASGCSDSPGSDADAATTVDAGVDGAPPSDASNQDVQNDGSTSDASVAQGPCSPGTYRCGPLDSVEICNASGTAWLYSATCTSGCSAGLCTGACTPQAYRCNGPKVEQCNGSGSAWSVAETCSTFCTNGTCALNGLDVGLNQNLDGEVWVKGEVRVHAGATLTSPTGNLTIHADSIVVEQGGAILVSAKGTNPAGKGPDGIFVNGNYAWGGGGGGYGTYGKSGAIGEGLTWGSDFDSDVEMGSPGGAGASVTIAGGSGGYGGGVLRLYATTIDIEGQLNADGGRGGDANVIYCTGSGGGGSGGGIIAAADKLTVGGNISAAGGQPGTLPQYCGNNDVAGGGSIGGDGRIKLLWGSTHSITGTLSGKVSQDLLPPIPVTSTSHPDPAHLYNDGAGNLLLSWTRPSSSTQGYYVRLDTSPLGPPTPSNGQFLTTDYTSFPASVLRAGDNYFHIVPIDSMSNLGGVETVFHLAINAAGPTISSSSHPNQSAWSTNANPFFQWTFPQGDSNVAGAYYILDHDGLTVPTTASTFLPVAQKQLQLNNVASGVWVLHMVSRDTRGYLTQGASHYRINIGTDPGSGGVLGQVLDGASQPASGATVMVNDGVYAQTADSNGRYNFTSVPAGSWTISASLGAKSGSASATVTVGKSTAANVTIQ